MAITHLLAIDPNFQRDIQVAKNCDWSERFRGLQSKGSPEKNQIEPARMITSFWAEGLLQIPETQCMVYLPVFIYWVVVSNIFYFHAYLGK